MQSDRDVQSPGWWHWECHNPFRLDPTKPRGPQIALAIFQCGVLVGGPLLGLVTIDYYPFLIQDHTLYVGGLFAIIILSLTTFIFWSGDDGFLRGIPRFFRVVGRIGWGGCATCLLLGVMGIANGYGTPITSRQAAVVSKHQTLQRDPDRRANYVAVRAWPSSRTVVELDAPRQVYDRLSVPVTAIDTPQETLNAMPDAGSVILIVGEGRFGLEWLKRIDAIDPDPSSR
jgi:hypothetical protein